MVILLTIENALIPKEKNPSSLPGEKSHRVRVALQRSLARENSFGI